MLGAVGVAAPALADVTPGDAAAALDLPAGVTAAVTGSGVVSSQAFNDFPSAGSSYLTLSTGDASQVWGSPQDAQLSTDVGNDGQPDTSSVTLSVAQSTGAQCLLVDFAMGTEEPVHTYDPAKSGPGDTLSILKAGDTTQYAMNAGRAYFGQTGWDPQPQPYSANTIGYWHAPGDATDAAPGAYSATEVAPRLPGVTGINEFTSRDTARVPLDLSAGDASITVSVSDASNGDLDSVATVDHVRLLTTGCASGTGVEPNPSNNGGVIGGIKQVGSQLYYDPVPSTSAIEGSDDVANGWRSPSNTPVELRYRWYETTTNTYAHSGTMANWQPIQDADRQSYVPTATDWGKYLIVLVSGVVDGRRIETFPSTGTAATWYVTTPIDYGAFVSGSPPTITGPDGGAHVGDILTAQVDNTFPRQDTWTWQWFANNAIISGETGQSLTVGVDQAGKTITVKATAVRERFDSKAWTSASYGPVLYEGFTAVDTPHVIDDGTPTIGETVTADPGSGWAPTPASYSYQWKRDGKVISGAVNASYTLTSTDAGTQLTVTVSGVLPGYAQVPQTSDPITVHGSTQLGATPTVSGTPQVGQTLTGTVVGWQPSGAALTFAWYAGTTLVQSGSSHYLKVPAAALGKPVTLRVTGTRSGFDPLTVSAAPTAAVRAANLTATRPSILGTAKVGSRLYANPGSWGPLGVKLSYQWRVNGHAVAGAAGRANSFKLPRTVRGKRVTVSVTGRLAGYATLTKTSAATKRVA